MKKWHLLFILITLYNLDISAQSSDSLKLVKFANFLEESQLYSFAAEEYERLLFRFPNQPFFFKKMIVNYRKSGELQSLEERLYKSNQYPGFVNKNFAFNLMESGSYDKAEDFVVQNKQLLGPSAFNKISMDIDLLQGQYRSVSKQFHNLKLEDELYYGLIEEGKKIKRKSPLVAGALSGLIPGLGRAYANDLTNGIISLIFVTSSGFQAYRRFKRDGSKSVTGWIYGGISLGFYIGNIYGSVQSSKYYNGTKREKFNERVKNHIDLYYSK